MAPSDAAEPAVKVSESPVVPMRESDIRPKALFDEFSARLQRDAARLAEKRAEFVEVPGDASSVVYVDDQSGWLVVWAAAEPGGKGE